MDGWIDEQVLETAISLSGAGTGQAENTQMGIEFLQPSPSFWQIDFPPDDWVVPEN